MKLKYFVSILPLMLITCFAAIMSCSEEDESPTQVTDAACIVKSSPSYFNTNQTFEYDQAGNLKTRWFPFGFPGYEPFTQTIDPTKSFYSYTSTAGLIEVTDVFIGGTGSIYDGLPDSMQRTERQTYTDGRPDFNSGPKTILIFEYDDAKRLKKVDYHHDLLTYDVYITYSRQLYKTTLELTYDDKDNVTKLKQSLVFREGVYVVNNPSDSYFSYEESEQTSINVTYDNKPSPYSAILKYWKFLQGDWGYVTNSNWNAIITALSKNNPVVISFETYQGNAVQTSNNSTYDYNEQGFPIGGYTYECK
jgi:hypothetical protein